MCMVIVCLIVEFPTFELPKKSKAGYPNFPLDLLFMYFFEHLGEPHLGASGSKSFSSLHWVTFGGRVSKYRRSIHRNQSIPGQTNDITPSVRVFKAPWWLPHTTLCIHG